MTLTACCTICGAASAVFTGRNRPAACALPVVAQTNPVSAVVRDSTAQARIGQPSFDGRRHSPPSPSKQTACQLVQPVQRLEITQVLAPVPWRARLLELRLEPSCGFR